MALTRTHPRATHAPPLTPVPEWCSFDDKTVTTVGGWAAVKEKLIASRYQPLVLFYERVDRL